MESSIRAKTDDESVTSSARRERPHLADCRSRSASELHGICLAANTLGNEGVAHTTQLNGARDCATSLRAFAPADIPPAAISTLVRLPSSLEHLGDLRKRYTQEPLGSDASQKIRHVDLIPLIFFIGESAAKGAQACATYIEEANADRLRGSRRSIAVIKVARECRPARTVRAQRRAQSSSSSSSATASSGTHFS